MLKMRSVYLFKGQRRLTALAVILALLIFSFSSLLTAGEVLAVAPSGFTSQTYEDSDGDGVIDQVIVVINGGEALTACTVTDVEIATDWTYVGNDIGGSLTSTGDSHSCVTGTATVTLKITGANASVTGHTTAPTIAYDNDDADASITNASGTLGTVGAANASDGASPVVVSVSPADLSSTVATADNIVITFSEAMVTTFAEATEFAFSPDPGSFSDAWTVGNTVVTINPATDFICGETYTVTTAEATIDAASGSPTVLVTTGPSDGDWSFTTKCGSGGGGSVTPLPTYSALLLSPNGGGSLTVGDTEEITWSTGGTGTLSYVDLLLSTDGGDSYTTIADTEANDGSYTWTVPNSVTSQAQIKVEAHNNVDPLATDTSDINFSIVAEVVVPVDETPAEVTEPGAGDLAPSPVTGEMEVVSLVNSGDLIRSSYFDAVYYVDSDMVRHPFFNEAIYATWYNDFDDVKIVTDATLSTLTLGVSMLPKPGVTWLKVASVDKVYLVETNPDDEFMPSLRWVTNESLGNELLGADWADYVIDIDVILFNRFDFGSDVLNAPDVTVDMNKMKKRVTLNI